MYLMIKFRLRVLLVEAHKADTYIGVDLLNVASRSEFRSTANSAHKKHKS